MRILLDQAVHDHRNKGNNALLEVTLQRLRHYWPAAAYEVISDAPNFCRTYIAGTQPTVPDGLFPSSSRSSRYIDALPNTIWQHLFELREISQNRTGFTLSAQQLGARIMALRNLEAKTPTTAVAAPDPRNGNAGAGRPDHEVSADAIQKYHRMQEYDLYVATGGGYMCDSDKYFLLGVLDRLEAAIYYGTPAVMVGQGVGPMDDLELQARASAVLPHLDYIFIREERVARPLLSSLGVPDHKIIMTGDDAIELAYEKRTATRGNGIGLSLRVAKHTEMSDGHVAALKPIIQQIAREHGAELVAAPISYYHHEADIDPISTIMEGYDRISGSWKKFEPLEAFIRRIGGCRVMISGTCHGAVFALSQGIPTICLAESTEYHNKLAGLAAEFGEPGCRVIRLGDDRLAENVAVALEEAWLHADELRAPLILQAQRQIDLGRGAYQRIFDLLMPERVPEVRGAVTFAA